MLGVSKCDGLALPIILRRRSDMKGRLVVVTRLVSMCRSRGAIYGNLICESGEIRPLREMLINNGLQFWDENAMNFQQVDTFDCRSREVQ